jgi:bifunctional non-homologous end joining protein LigD
MVGGVPGAPLIPMLATAGVLPAGPGWSYEFKWDGVRVLMSSSGHLWARSGAEVTRAYPELAAPAAALPGDTLLDGEVVALVDGRPSFTRLGERMHVRDTGKAARLVVTTPITYMAFDLLRISGKDLLTTPYAERRAMLEDLGLGGPAWMVPPAFTDGAATSAAARENGLEGVMAKRVGTPYLPGVRSPDWVKVKFDRTGDYVIGGWRPGARRLGGLLVGVPDTTGCLHFRGRGRHRRRRRAGTAGGPGAAGVPGVALHRNARAAGGWARRALGTTGAGGRGEVRQPHARQAAAVPAPPAAATGQDPGGVP